MPCLRHSSPADKPAACSFRTLIICSSVNLLFRMSVSRRNRLYPNSGACKGSTSARLYRPEGNGPFPTMIELHGGVWTDNDRRRGLIHHEWFARSGIAVAALDFRQGRAGYPNSLIDINYGIRWVKAHADLLNSNPGLVGITGSSSGGHLAMLAAMRPHDPRYRTTSSPAEMSA